MFITNMFSMKFNEFNETIGWNKFESALFIVLFFCYLNQFDGRKNTEHITIKYYVG